MYYLHKHIVDFLKNYLGPRNKLFKAILDHASNEAYIAGCKALGLIDKLVTGPLWHVMESDLHILDMSTYYTRLYTAVSGQQQSRCNWIPHRGGTTFPRCSHQKRWGMGCTCYSISLGPHCSAAATNSLQIGGIASSEDACITYHWYTVTLDAHKYLPGDIWKNEFLTNGSVLMCKTCRKNPSAQWNATYKAINTMYSNKYVINYYS